MRSTRVCVWMLFAMLFSGISHANLIVDGGFENPEVNYGGWRWFHASDVDGWEGSNIEVWDNLYGFAAFEGEQHAELNAHSSNGGAFSIYQTFASDAGEQYALNFAYAARRNTHESFLVELLGDTGAFWSAVMDDHLVRQWSEFTTTFSAQSAETTLRFTAISPLAGTVGNLLDAVSVVKLSGLLEEVSNDSQGTINATPIHAPSIWVFFLLSVMFAFKRRQQNI